MRVKISPLAPIEWLMGAVARNVRAVPDQCHVAELAAPSLGRNAMKRRILLSALLAVSVTGCSGTRMMDQLAWNATNWDTHQLWGFDKHQQQYVRQINRDGPSEFTFSNGDKLTGTFKGGFVLSPARVDYADGKVFYGSFLKNTIHGVGTMTYPNGDRYDGYFVKGRRHGRGTYRFATGGRYTGDFNNDMLTGVGSFVYANGDTYTGQVLNGMHHGRGKQTFAGGRVPLEGVWEHGAFVQMEKLN
ncbi:MAG: hypothetical protein RL404_1093 [Pseudomonadota bacterium]